MAIPALLAAVVPAAIKVVGGGIKALFGYKEKKVDLSILRETNDRDLQLAWWDYLKSQSSSIINQVLRPITMSLFIGDFIYQRIVYDAYKLIEIIPQMNFGDTQVGPIYNGHILLFIIFFMFPLRFLEKIFMKKE